MLGLNLTIIVLGIVQLIWLFKAFQRGGIPAVLNLLLFSLLTAALVVLQDCKTGGPMCT